MSAVYATVEEYRVASGDEASADARVAALLEEMSAELRAECGISPARALTEDQATLARKLVTDSVRKALVVTTVGGQGVVGVTQASWGADGFSEQYTLSNPSGSAYFDTRALARLKSLLGRGQLMGYVWPGGGRRA